MIDPKLFLNDISPIDHGDDSRYFYKDKGVPSVTELLSFIDNQGLIDWANMIGRKGQNNKDIVKRAAESGTNSHAAIECYLKNIRFSMSLNKKTYHHKNVNSSSVNT